MSAPLFIQTPYMEATHVNDGGPGAGILETIATNSALVSTTLLIETVRFWLRPAPWLAPEDHAPERDKLRSCGKPWPGFEVRVLTPAGEVIYLEQHEVAAQAEGLYADPVIVQLDLQLPPGYSLQLISTSLAIVAAVAQNCYVVAQGGVLG